ncbi:hypothetical protein [Agrococcus sp. HG114]|uniref:hypothetical protein n=1 Tax=Agrococcus sp. HG114 TaxID=2969757 RepID=UPI00215A5DC4|nr:hypothetical protein [Agrococcus sp. HG114]MCR8669583.1 hypothetical protein [Agrococcus sp. HG114]
MIREDPWYTARRERWRPERVRLLLVAESPPAVDGGQRRYFYDDDLLKEDGLFREVAKGLCNAGSLRSGAGAKVPWLGALRDAGVFLIDLSPVPVNRLGANRNRTLASSVADCTARAVALGPEGVILVKRSVHELLADPFKAASLPLLHEEPVPFPGSGQQRRFQERFAAAVAALNPPLDLPIPLRPAPR